MQPIAIEAARLASQEESGRRDAVLAALERDLEAARYAAHRAQKQYDATDPENRLVADELECRWNHALEHVRDVEGHIAQQVGIAPRLPAPTAYEFTDLAGQLEAVWNRPDADARLKKRIVRALIHEVMADVDRSTSEIVLVIHWRGGVHTELRIPHRRRGQNSTHTSKDTVHAIRVLARVCPDRLIAGLLNRNGLRTGRGNFWTEERVTLPSLLLATAGR